MFVCAIDVPGICGVPERQAVPLVVHVPQEEPQEKDHGENTRMRLIVFILRF